MVVELFGGIGAIRKALINLKLPHKIIDYVENDKNAVKSYKDFSRMGLGRGGVKGSGTRSSLLFETVRIIEEATQKPKWVIWENVKGVLDKTKKDTFLFYISEMKRLGYDTKYKVLNSYDFGIPQKRERVFAISYFGENKFDFSNLEKTSPKSLQEYLEKGVSNLYTVRQKSMLRLLFEEGYKEHFKKRIRIITDFAYTIMTSQMSFPNSGLIEIEKDKYRYLTERECFRLMGFTDSDFDKISPLFPRRKNCTSSILYKQAGNSIVVNVLEEIIKEIVRIENS